MRLLSRLLPLLVVTSLGCAQPEWTVLVDDTDLDRVVLSIGGDSLSSTWAVGGPLGSPGDALAMRRTGGGWQEVPTGFTETLWWVWVSGEDDVFMVGEGGRIARWDGTAIQTMTSPTTVTLYGVWGAAADDVWAVGGDPIGGGDTDVILHYDGSAWSTVTLPGAEGVVLFKVWGASADDVWVVGQRGTILHYDGSAWAHVTSPTTAHLFTVAGNASGDVWAVGGPPAVVLHREGGGFVEVEPAGPASLLNGVAVSDAGEGLVVGARGTKWWRGADGVWLDEFDVPPIDDLHAAWIGGEDAMAAGGNFNAPSSVPRTGVLAYRGTAAPAGGLMP